MRLFVLHCVLVCGVYGCGVCVSFQCVCLCACVRVWFLLLCVVCVLFCRFVSVLCVCVCVRVCVRARVRVYVCARMCVCVWSVCLCVSCVADSLLTGSLLSPAAITGEEDRINFPCSTCRAGGGGGGGGGGDILEQTGRITLSLPAPWACVWWKRHAIHPQATSTSNVLTLTLKFFDVSIKCNRDLMQGFKNGVIHV